MMKNLDIDEIMVLQAFGLQDTEIMKMHLDGFERVLDENLTLRLYLTRPMRFLTVRKHRALFRFPGMLRLSRSGFEKSAATVRQ